MKKEVREGYKMTELGEIPNDWSIKKIGDLIQCMKSGLSRNLKEDDIGIPCIRSNNIINSKICGDELKYWYLEDDKGANIRDYILNDGDILINFINSTSQIGKGCIYKDIGRPAIYTTNIFRVQMEKKVMNNLYFNYFIQTEFYKKEIVLITKLAINQASFTIGDFKNIKLVVPTMKEQEKIAEILSTVDEQIENTEKLIQKNQELKKGLMQQLLTKGIGHTEFKKTELGYIPKEWKIKKIYELVQYMKSGLSRNLKDDDIGIPCIRSNNIIDNKIDDKDLKYWYLEDDKGANINEYILDDGDILVNFINSVAQIGKTCIYKDIGRPVIYTTNIFRIKMNQDVILNKYFYYFTQIEKYKKAIMLITKPAVNQASFTTQDFKRIELMVPPIEEQDKIVLILSSIDEKIEEYKNKKESLKEVKKGLMEQLLTGKLRID
ncbi:restriction endonuclease subunit S [Clostridium perfringens]|uniref:restriction endonuclease subunit S n=1 Tax=Clostridium perfringens TaxID=1502 RepID=UPI0030D00C73